MLGQGCSQKPAIHEGSADQVDVTLQPVRTMDYKVPVRATGLLGTQIEMKLSFKTGGIIRKISVNEGDAVKRGTVLAELDLSEVKAQVKQARIALEKSQRDLTRAENLFKDSVVTLEQYQDVQSANELAKARKKVADFNLQHSRIIAPASGKVQKIMSETNEMIAVGHPVLLFASTEGDWVVRAAISDKDVVKLSLGDSARIVMDAYPGARFLAMVTEIGTIADPYTGSYEVELSIYRPRSSFRTGFFSRAEIYPSFSVSSLMVPLESLLDAQDNLASVYLWKEDQAVKKRIRTGGIQQGMVVVVDGLKEGDLVVTDGAKFIRPGSQVHPVNLENIGTGNSAGGSSAPSAGGSSALSAGGSSVPSDEDPSVPSAETNLP
ncbi:MAG: efflux RND transporter periplasmic adaptor subunit [Bacteroidales bacterium]